MLILCDNYGEIPIFLNLQCLLLWKPKIHHANIKCS